MEDDGILLNFSTTPSVPKKAPVKRGNDRGVVPVASTDPTSDPASTLESEEAAAAAAANGLAPGTKVLHGRAQIASSLFSSNPLIPTTYQKKSLSTRQGASNAPMVDSSSFTGIGIESDLADHLVTKFNVTTPTNVQAKAIPVLLGPSSSVKSIHSTEDVDVVVQAETGSGKTLTYLLPIVNRLIAASTAPKDVTDPTQQPFGDRMVGTVAIILTPTRELAQQVLGVLTQIVSLPRPKDENMRRLHWIVPGIVIGGDSKAKEKARLRKGVNVLVSTPGRLLDHLENTKSFDISNLKWLVLDEADRLLDLGFEESLKKIMNYIDDRTMMGGNEKYRDLLIGKQWPKRRQTILCSATLRDDVKQLAGWSLVKPAFVSGTDTKRDASKLLSTTGDYTEEDEEMKFTTPNQLKQTYTIVPAKLRLITLLALLKSCFYDKRTRKTTNSKIIVFFSCCDSVDFHYDLFAHAGKPILDEDSDEEDNGDDDETKIMKKALNDIVGKKEAKKFSKNLTGNNKNFKSNRSDDIAAAGDGSEQQKKKKAVEEASQISTLLGEKQVFRLHGDLNQQIRSQTFAEFSRAKSGVLFCTDVAARGLDLPNVDRIIQYDVPTDLKDYVHRAGRTARLGKTGEATLFLLPSEMDYLDVLKAQALFPESITMETILKNIAEHGDDFQTPAQDIQNTMENYILADESVSFIDSF